MTKTFGWNWFSFSILLLLVEKQGPPMMPFDRHVKQPITVCFVQCHVSGCGNVATITDRCVILSDVF